ncbi:DMT family transporter [Portibacter marinus]|uniref:DMT family transporter n=1 Tax=Portibacter marinus TaxID=2898660 RepID=UPI001F2EB940|nr:DMT family transporter [Portibacter marinus]
MKTWVALKYMIISTFSFTLMSATIKYLEDFNAFELVFFRCLGSLVLCIIYLWIKGIPILGNRRKLMIGRGIVGVISMVLFFAALKLMPLGTTISLRYLAPIFTAIFSIFLLKEKLIPIQWLFFFLSFAGVILLKGIDLRVSTVGLIMVLGAAMFSGLVYIFLRAIGPADHPVVIVNYFMVIATVVGAIGSINNWQQPEGYQWPLLFSLGIFGYLGQLYMTKAFQIEEANKVAPMKYLEAVFAIFVGWIWFGEGHSWLAIIGMLMVIGGMLMNIMVKKTSAA